MIYDEPKYLHFARKLTNSSFPEVASFATTVSDNIGLFYNGTLTMEQFDDGIYIDIPDGLSDEEKLQRSSINYIKQCVILGFSPPHGGPYNTSVEPLTGSFLPP